VSEIPPLGQTTADRFHEETLQQMHLNLQTSTTSRASRPSRHVTPRGYSTWPPQIRGTPSISHRPLARATTSCRSSNSRIQPWAFQRGYQAAFAFLCVWLKVQTTFVHVITGNYQAEFQPQEVSRDINVISAVKCVHHWHAYVYPCHAVAYNCGDTRSSSQVRSLCAA
jgi:hypothetical protein